MFNRFSDNERIVDLAAYVLAVSFFVFGMLISSASHPAHAATPGDVRTIVNLIEDVNAARRLPEDEVDQSSIAFATKGMRFTIYHIPNRVPPLLAFIVMDKGRAHFVTCTLDGKVREGGTDGGRNNLAAGRFPPNSGTRRYWQEKLDSAIKATLDYKREVDEAERIHPLKPSVPTPKSNTTHAVVFFVPNTHLGASLPNLLSQI